MAPIATSELQSTNIHGDLTLDQKAAWDQDGYLIIPDFLSTEIITALRNETHTLLKEFPLETHPLTKFSADDDDRHTHYADDYFLESNDKVRFFFETDAFDKSGKLNKPKERAINKIGHCLHELSKPFRDATFTKRNASIARDLGFKDPRVLQSMVICKQPEIGGKVDQHQDSTFLYTNPPSAVGFWFALEDATLENGCLSFAKGSHRRTPVKTRMMRMDDKLEFSKVEPGATFPQNFESRGEPLEKEQYTPGPVKAGSLVLIHGNILHQSEKNVSQKSRNIYTFHLIEGGLEYDDKNWLQPPKDGSGFSRLYRAA